MCAPCMCYGVRKHCIFPNPLRSKITENERSPEEMHNFAHNGTMDAWTVCTKLGTIHVRHKRLFVWKMLLDAAV